MQSSVQFRRNLAGMVDIHTIMTATDSSGKVHIVPEVSNELHAALCAENSGSVIASQAL